MRAATRIAAAVGIVMNIRHCPKLVAKLVSDRSDPDPKSLIQGIRDRPKIIAAVHSEAGVFEASSCGR